MANIQLYYTQMKTTLLVLSCGITEDGVLGDDAQASVRIAAKLWNQDAARLIIMCGRLSYKADFVPPVSEAQAMKDYALSLGVASNGILTEAESKDTLGNAVFARLNLLDPLSIEEVLIIPGPNHSTERLEFIFNKVFADDIAYSFIERSEEWPDQQHREQKSLETLKGWLDDVKDGDVMQIYQVMRAKHPGYHI